MIASEVRDVLSLQRRRGANPSREKSRSRSLEINTRGLAPRAAVDPEAYEAYLKRLYYSNKRTAHSKPKAALNNEQAISKEPGSRLTPYSGLADCNRWTGPARVYVPSGGASEGIRSETQKAVEIDPQSAGGLTPR